jgi:hypothetical protein
MLRVGMALVMGVFIAAAGCNGDEGAETADGESDEGDPGRAARGANEHRTCNRGRGGEAYRDLRRLVLQLDPSEAGLRPTPSLPRVYGVMMETGYPEGCVTLVALADGSASLYLSAGTSMIGGGENESVAQRAKLLVQAAEEDLDLMPRASTAALPAVGSVVLRALTYDGYRELEAPEDDLGYERHELSALFHAGHDVITAMRQQARRSQ